MTTTRGTQMTWMGTASGLFFVIAQFAGFGTGAAARGFERITLASSSPEVVEALSTPVPTAVWVGGYIEVIAYLAFLVFAGCLAARLHASESAAWPAFVVLAAGVLVVATSMIGYATEGAAYYRAGSDIDPTAVRALLDVANLAFVLVWSFLAILLFAAAASSVLSRWLRIAAVVLGITLLAAFAAPSSPLGEIADLALWIWVVTVSVAFTSRRAPQDRANGRVQEAAIPPE